jgi:hypothetical protein
LDDAVKNIDVSQIDFIIHDLQQLKITTFNDAQQSTIKNLWIFLEEQKNTRTFKRIKIRRILQYLTHSY